MKREPDFKSEAELCAAFIAWANAIPGWTCYAETEGWDILVVHADGTQIGVQAKLKFNMAVLSQCVEDGQGWNTVGPDYRAALVPASQGSCQLCDALGITLIHPRKGWIGDFAFEPTLAGGRTRQRWHYRNPEKRHPLPRFVPDVPAGVPSPSPLTKWKIAALQIMAVLELRGYVTRHDFRLAGIDHRRWMESWLEPVEGKAGAWRMLSTAPDFRTNHPVVYPQVLAEVRQNKLYVLPPERVLV